MPFVLLPLTEPQFVQVLLDETASPAELELVHTLLPEMVTPYSVMEMALSSVPSVRSVQLLATGTPSILKYGTVACVILEDALVVPSLSQAL